MSRAPVRQSTSASESAAGHLDAGNLNTGKLDYVRMAFEDTLAVAFAGWGEPVTRKVAANYDAQSMTPLAPAGAPPNVGRS